LCCTQAQERALYGSRFFSMVISLMPTEEIAEEFSASAEGLPEGSKVRARR